MFSKMSKLGRVRLGEDMKRVGLGFGQSSRIYPKPSKYERRLVPSIVGP